MPLYPLFILLIAVGLREQHTISASAVLGLLLWSPRWRRPANALHLLLLAALVLTLAPLFIEWRKWYVFEPPHHLVYMGSELRQWLSRRISRIAHGPFESFLRAIIIGDKDGLHQETIQAFGVLGIRHMLAVSGFHIGILTSMFTPFLKVHKHRYWQFLLTLVLIIFFIVYAAAVGGTSSVIRSVGSFTIARLALLAQVKVSSMQWPMVMGILCFLFEPRLITTIGFQLSYAAVFAILIVLRNSDWAHFLQHYQIVKHPKIPFWLGTIQISLAAWIGTLPIVVHYFGVASPFFLLGNLFVVPVYTVFIWAGLIGILFGSLLPPNFIEWWNSTFERWNDLVVSKSALLIT